MGGLITDNTVSNIHVVSAAATAWENTIKYVRLIQWVDDAGDIADDSTLVININNVTLTTKLQLAANISNYGVVVWQIGPFNPGIPVHTLKSVTQGTGIVHIYTD